MTAERLGPFACGSCLPWAERLGIRQFFSSLVQQHHPAYVPDQYRKHGVTQHAFESGGPSGTGNQSQRVYERGFPVARNFSGVSFT